LNYSPSSLHFTNNTLPPFSRATKIPTTSVAAASPTAGKTRRRRHQSLLEASPARTQLPELSPFSFFSRARGRPNPGVLPLHTTPLRPRVCQLRPPRPGLPPRRHCRLQSSPSSSCVEVAHLNTKSCGRCHQDHHHSRLRLAGGDATDDFSFLFVSIESL